VVRDTELDNGEDREVPQRREVLIHEQDPVHNRRGTGEAIYTRDKTENLKSINLSVEKLRIFFRLSHDRKYIAMNQYEYISTQLDEFGKMIGGWLKTCEG